MLKIKSKRQQIFNTTIITAFLIQQDIQYQFRDIDDIKEVYDIYVSDNTMPPNYFGELKFTIL